MGDHLLVEDGSLAAMRKYVFDTDGSPREPHHKTVYQYPHPVLMPTTSRAMLVPPSRSAERIDPRLRGRPSTVNQTCHYTYSRIDNKTRQSSLIATDEARNGEGLWSAMTRVSAAKGTTILSMMTYSEDLEPDEVWVTLRRSTRLQDLESRNVVDGKIHDELVEYTLKLSDWTSVSRDCEEQQWYKELESLRLRTTERAWWHVQYRIEMSHSSPRTLVDAQYKWFDVDVFGDTNPHRPIVWWGHPDRNLAALNAIQYVPVSDLGDDDHDRKCPICMESYNTSTDGIGQETISKHFTGERPARIACRCGRACGEDCLKEWLLQEGPSRCPSCRDDAGVQTFMSPYTGGWCCRQPRLQHHECHDRISLGGSEGVLNHSRLVIVSNETATAVSKLFPSGFETIAPCWSANPHESYRFLLTDPAPQYHFNRDPTVTQLVSRYLMTTIQELAKGQSGPRTFSEVGLHDYLREGVSKVLAEDFGGSYFSHVSSMLEPVVEEWVGEVCVRVTKLATYLHEGPRYSSRVSETSEPEPNEEMFDNQYEDRPVDESDDETERYDEVEGGADNDDDDDGLDDDLVAEIITEHGMDGIRTRVPTDSVLIDTNMTDTADEPSISAIDLSDEEHHAMEVLRIIRQAAAGGSFHAGSEDQQAREAEAQALRGPITASAAAEAHLDDLLDTLIARFGPHVLAANGQLNPYTLQLETCRFLRARLARGVPPLEVMDHPIFAMVHEYLTKRHPGTLPGVDEVMLHGTP